MLHLTKNKNTVTYCPHAQKSQSPSLEDAFAAPLPPSLSRRPNINDWIEDHFVDIDRIVKAVQSTLTDACIPEHNLQIHFGNMRKSIEEYLYRSFNHDVM